MKTFFILLFAFISINGTYSSKVLNEVSYPQLSLRYTYSTFLKIDVSIINNNTVPGHLSKLRKQLLLTRTFLDIFAYAYPTGGPVGTEGGDRFEILRKILNKGYTLIGNFDDLQHVNFTEADRIKLLDKCLEWKGSYLDDIDNYNFKMYLNNVSKNVIVRNKDTLSIDFWGNITAVPTDSLSGYQNLGLLAKGQLNNCIDRYTYTTSLKDIWNKEYHELFHDYRKLVRSINFVADHFPEIYTSSVKNYVQTLEKAYGLLGKINDLINEYTYYVHNGDSGAAAQKQQEIIEKWSDLLKWFGQVGLKNTLVNMIKLVPSVLRSFGPTVT